MQITQQISVAFLGFLGVVSTAVITFLSTRYTEQRKSAQAVKAEQTAAGVEALRIEQVDAPGEMAKQWTSLLEQQASILAEERSAHAEERKRWLTEAEAHREGYEDRLAQLEEKVVRMQTKLDTKDKELEAKDAELHQCHERIGELHSTLRQRDETITEQNETIKSLRLVRQAEEALLEKHQIAIPTVTTQE